MIDLDNSAASSSQTKKGLVKNHDLIKKEANANQQLPLQRSKQQVNGTDSKIAAKKSIKQDSTFVLPNKSTSLLPNGKRDCQHLAMQNTVATPTALKRKKR